MKFYSSVLIAMIAFAFGLGSLTAANSDFEFHCVPRRIDQTAKSAAEGGAAVTKEQWVYDITIENKTFKETKDLVVKYLVFYTKEQLGVKAAASAQRKSGTLMVPSLKPHEKKVVSTEQVEITKKHLVGNYIYSFGAKPNSTDTLGGVWLRVMQEDQQVAEFANPSTLTKEKWE